MGRITGIFRFEFENDQRIAWEAVHTGVVDKNTATRRKYWRYWVQYTSYLGIGPYLQGRKDDAVVVLLGFEARVRSGAFRKGKRVGVQSITDTLVSSQRLSKWEDTIIPHTDITNIHPPP